MDKVQNSLGYTGFRRPMDMILIFWLLAGAVVDDSAFALIEMAKARGFVTFCPQFKWRKTAWSTLPQHISTDDCVFVEFRNFKAAFKLDDRTGLPLFSNDLTYGPWWVMMGCWLKSSLDFVTKSFRDRTLCWEEQQSLRVLMCECCFNAVGFCCSCLYGTGRSIPLISIFSFILFLIGYSLALSGRTATSKPLETMGVTTLTGFMQDLEVAFFFAFVPHFNLALVCWFKLVQVNKICVLQSFWEEQAVSSVKVFNGLGLIASFLASGKTREFLFQRTDYCCTSCFQFLLGRCTLGIIVSFCLLILLVAPWTKIWLPNHSEFFNVIICTQRQFQLFQTIWTIWAWQPLLWILLLPFKTRTLFCWAWWQAHRHWFSKSLEHVRWQIACDLLSLPRLRLSLESNSRLRHLTRFASRLPWWCQ